MEEVRKSIVISGIATLLVLSLATSMDVVRAVGMSSSSYKIQSDSINFGGGQSNSASYKLESTAGEVATGDSSSSNYRLLAGYQQMHQVYLALDDTATDVIMTPALGGVAGGTSNGATGVTVTTDNPAGYAMYIKASSSPAMQGNATADSIADYTPAGSDPDLVFSVPANAAEFGFTPEGVDIVGRYVDDGGTCNDGSSDTPDACWDGLSTTNKLIASRTSANHPTGSGTTLKFRLTIGSSAFKLEDVYTATSTLTVVPL